MTPSRLHRQVKRWSIVPLVGFDALATLGAITLAVIGAGGLHTLAWLGAALATGTNTPAPSVLLVDERFTSATAERHLMETRRPGRLAKDGTLDSASAAVLLQSWLDGAAAAERP